MVSAHSGYDPSRNAADRQLDQMEPLAGGSRSRFPPLGGANAKPPTAALLTGQAVRKLASAAPAPGMLICLFLRGKEGAARLSPNKAKIGLPVLPPLAFGSLRAGSTRIRMRGSRVAPSAHASGG